ncbi:MAG: small basic protein [Candidatus Omnitrophota bacterium]|nr:MAG: small basic protein [Candidatus Omnitrophota bacterium]
MAQHPSLRSKQKGKQHRSVLKRYERVKELKEKEKWKEGDSVFGLLKLKILKFKIKKEKAAPAAEAVPGAEGAGAPAAEGAGTAEKTKDTKKEAAAKKEPPKKGDKK